MSPRSSKPFILAVSREGQTGFFTRAALKVVGAALEERYGSVVMNPPLRNLISQRRLDAWLVTREPVHRSRGQDLVLRSGALSELIRAGASLAQVPVLSLETVSPSPHHLKGLLQNAVTVLGRTLYRPLSKVLASVATPGPLEAGHELLMAAGWRRRGPPCVGVVLGDPLDVPQSHFSQRAVSLEAVRLAELARACDELVSERRAQVIAFDLGPQPGARGDLLRGLRRIRPIEIQAPATSPSALLACLSVCAVAVVLHPHHRWATAAAGVPAHHFTLGPAPSDPEPSRDLQQTVEALASPGPHREQGLQEMASLRAKARDELEVLFRVLGRRGRLGREAGER